MLLLALLLPSPPFEYATASVTFPARRRKKRGLMRLVRHYTNGTITGDDAAHALSAISVPDGANTLLLTANGSGIRFWADGNSPSSSSGIPVPDGDTIDFTSANGTDEQLTSILSNVSVYVPSGVSVFWRLAAVP